MSLLRTARLNGLEPYAYVKDVLERLPTQPASTMTELLPYRWSPATLRAPSSSVKMTGRTHTSKMTQVLQQRLSTALVENAAQCYGRNRPVSHWVCPHKLGQKWTLGGLAMHFIFEPALLAQPP